MGSGYLCADFLFRAFFGHSIWWSKPPSLPKPLNLSISHMLERVLTLAHRSAVLFLVAASGYTAVSTVGLLSNIRSYRKREESKRQKAQEAEPAKN
jgi:hypothetical protein